MLSDNYVGIAYAEKIEYPNRNIKNWFRPSEKYNEFGDEPLSSERNYVYESVREAFHLMKMDEANYGTEKWNPLGEIIRPWDNVLLKPNLVMDYNQSDEGTDCLYTQAAVVAPVLDYVIKALDGKGSITIGDAPMQECKFEKLIDESGYKEMLSYYAQKGVDINLVDFRELVTEVQGKGMVRKQTIRDGALGTIVKLDNESEFAKYTKERIEKMRITNYSPDRLKQHHNENTHEYYVSNYVLNADVVINMPKPKTHRKAGFTAAMKNMVGINVRKEFLPHHSIGSISEGGDEHKDKSLFRNIADFLYDKKNTYEGKGKYNRSRVLWITAHGFVYLASKLKKDVYEGNWYGNQTISKTIVDLNKILLFVNKEGLLKQEKQRKVLSIGDMIISGEKEGPVAPSPKEIGAVIISSNSFAFDYTVGTMMGADVEKVSFIIDARNGNPKFRLLPSQEPIIVSSNDDSINNKKAEEINNNDKWHFIPTEGWKPLFN